MNELKLIVELCAEDRARLDKIIEKLGQRPDCSACVASVADTIDRASKVLDGQTEKDDIAEMCEKIIKNANPAEPAKNATEEPKASDHPTLDPFPEKPEAKAEASEEPKNEAKPTVTMEMLRSKAITLAAAGKKDQVRAVVHPYAAKVTDLPENVWAEVFEKLEALEG